MLGRTLCTNQKHLDTPTPFQPCSLRDVTNAWQAPCAKVIPCEAMQ